MSKLEFSRPFNLEHAKAGAPYCCRDGEDATILKWDCRDPNFPLVGIFGDSDDATEWSAAGQYNCQLNPEYDLVMLPLGFIDGKPVFVGDEIISERDGKAHVAYAEQRNFNGARWPSSTPAYPVTRMQLKDFDIAIISSGSKECVDARAACAIANAAIAMALIDGDVVLPGAVPSDDLLMKVAKEVWCRATGQEHFLNEKEEYFRSIIASVTGAKDAQPIDCSITQGDMVYRKTWGEGKQAVEVVDINWALKAIAVKLSPTGGTVVWPVEGMTKESFSEDAKEGAK